MYRIALFCILVFVTACKSENTQNKNEETADNLSEVNENVGQDLPTEVMGELPSILEYSVSADPMFPNSYNAYNLRISEESAPYYFLVWDVEELGDPIEDHLNKIEKKGEDHFELITDEEVVYILKKNSAGWMMEDSKMGERYFLTPKGVEESEDEILSKEEFQKQLSFLNDYPETITDRKQMKEILNHTGLATSDDSDQSKMLHDIQYNKSSNAFYYDPCDDWTGHSTSEAFQLSGSDDYTGITEDDQPSFYQSSQDTYAWKIKSFTKISNGLEFQLENYNNNGKHYLILTDYGFWTYKTDFGNGISYKTVKKNLDKLRHEPDDCPGEYDVY